MECIELHVFAACLRKRFRVDRRRLIACLRAKTPFPSGVNLHWTAASALAMMQWAYVVKSA
jgi:hypothetical protein